MRRRKKVERGAGDLYSTFHRAGHLSATFGELGKLPFPALIRLDLGGANQSDGRDGHETPKQCKVGKRPKMESLRRWPLDFTNVTNSIRKDRKRPEKTEKDQKRPGGVVAEPHFLPLTARIGLQMTSLTCPPTPGDHQMSAQISSALAVPSRNPSMVGCRTASVVGFPAWAYS